MVHVNNLLMRIAKRIYRKISLILIIVITLATSIISIYQESNNSSLLLAHAQASNSEIMLRNTNLYFSKYLDTNLSIYKAFAYENNVIALGGSRGNENLVEVIRLSSDLGRASYTDFLLHGNVTSISAPSTLSNILVVGTSLGEVAVIDLLENKITYIQASRYPIIAIYSGYMGSDLYIIAFDGYFVYSYRYAEPGWLEIGPINSSMIMGFTPATITYVTPLVRVKSDSIEYDLSKIFIVYSPPIVKLVLNISDSFGLPVSGAVIHLVYIKNPDIYYSTTSINGTAILEIPVLDINGSLYQLRITHPLYETYNETILVPMPSKIGETLSKLIILKQGEGVSEILRPVPERSFVAVYELDLSSKPYRATQKASLLVPVKVSKAFFYEPGNNVYPYKYVALYATDRGLYATYYDSQLRIIKIDGADYIYYYLSISDPSKIYAEVSNDGENIVFSAGSKIYLASYLRELSRHIITSSYVFDSDVSDISVSSSKTITATTISGQINIFKIESSLLRPCLRSNYYSEYPSESSLYTFITRDNSQGFFVGTNRVLIVDSRRISERCDIEKIILKIVPEIESLREEYIGVYGRAYIYEGDVLVAETDIKNSLGVVYVPRSIYNIVLDSAQTGRVSFTSISLGENLINPLRVSVIPIDLLIRVRADMSSIPLNPITAPTGSEISIRNLENNYSFRLILSSNPLPIYMSRGRYEVEILYRNNSLAKGTIDITSPGINYADLSAKTSRLNIKVISSIDESYADPNSYNLSIVFNGPLWRGYSYNLRGSQLILPLGFYRIDLSSIYYLATSSDIELFNDTEAVIKVIPSVFDLKLILVDELNRSVGKATIYLKNTRTGVEYTAVSDDSGIAIVRNIIYGNYTLYIVPENKLFFQATNLSLLVNDTTKKIVVKSVYRKLDLYIGDEISESLIRPVLIEISIDGRVVSTIETTSNNISVYVPVGFMNISIIDASKENIYRSYNTSLLFSEDKELRIVLKRAIVNLRFEVYDSLGKPLDASISIASIENNSLAYSISVSRGVAETSIAYGDYLIKVSAPFCESTTVRIYSTTLRLDDTNIIAIKLDNIILPINISLIDQLNTPLRGQFNIEAIVDGRTFNKISTNTSRAVIYVPAGYNVSIKVSPVETNQWLYQTVSKDLGFVDNSRNTTIIIARKIYRISFSLHNDIGQPLVAKVILTNRENPAFTYDTSTDPDGLGIVAVPAGEYFIEISSSGYQTLQDTIVVNSDIEKKIILNPTIPTLLLRFTSLYIGIGVIIIILIVALWLRRIVLKRLEEEVI